ncbi:MAG: T9SS type A sorting domain-containing protein [Cytophagaceae bacterium]|nr:T9SS type A sorting domain-containing protein [Cytophagaceae bacterium]
MKKSVHLLLLLVSIGPFCYAQRLSPQVLAPAGGSARTATMTLDWTMGEIATQTATVKTNIYTQGFHQPRLQVEKLAPAESFYRVSAVPNPVTSILTVRVESGQEGDLHLDLLDLNGRTVFTKSTYAADVSVEMNLADLPAGLYLLQVRNATGRIAKTHKVLKN